MSLRKQAISGFAWSLTDKFVSQLAYLTVSVYLARLIGPDGYGLIAMLAIFIAIANSLVDSGFSAALVQRSHQMTEADASTIFYTNVVAAMVLYGVLYLAAPAIAAFYHQPELLDISRFLFSVVIINAFTVVLQAKLTIKVDFKSLAIVNTTATVISAALALWLASSGYGYWALVWQTLLRAVVAALGFWLICRWWPQKVFSLESFFSLFRFGSNLLAAGLVSTLVNNLYALFIGRIFAPAQVAYFNQAANLSNYLYGFISSSLQGVTYPIMTSIKEDRERLISIYKQLISTTMLVTLPMLAGLAAISQDFVVLLLGDAWLPMVPVLALLCFARTVTPISSINMNILNAVGRSDLFLKVDLSKLPLTLGALFLAVPYGIETLAKVMVATSFIAFFINAYYPGRLFGFGGLAQLKVAKNYVFASALMFFSVKYFPLEPGYFALGFKVCLGVAIYVVTLFLLNDYWFKGLAKSLFLALRQRIIS